MRYSKAFIPTLKEAPKDATNPSHVLLLRGGYIRMVGAGIYELLPLGLRVLRKIERIVREEMNRAGAEELSMPSLLPAEYFKQSGRWDTFGDTLIRLKDRKGADYNLGPTHEEIITDLVRREVRSYKQLPLNLYQIQTKFRDEPRPRAGLLRGREFIMKDAYSFDADETGALRSYETMRETYHRIFSRLGLDYRIVAADSGAMGGSTSAEFQVLADTGEDAIVACSSCDYAANLEIATTSATTPAQESSVPANRPEKIHTPGAGGIIDVVNYVGREFGPEQMLKSLLYVAGDRTVLVVVRGDHEVNELRLARVLGVDEVRLAPEAEVRKQTGAAVGFAGPVGYSGEIIADRAVPLVRNAVTGANETDHHLKNVNFGRDFNAKLEDIRLVQAGDPCPKCGSALNAFRGIEGGHIFILGTHYSSKMGATFLDDKGKETALVMGCYGIGVSRLLAAAVEQNHDADGIVWPVPIAPFEMMITPIGKDTAVAETATQLYEAFVAAGIETILDDRDERPGVKFKDADLLGIPLRITVGAKGLAEGTVELQHRSKKAEVHKVKVADAVRAVAEEVRGARETTTHGELRR